MEKNHHQALGDLKTDIVTLSSHILSLQQTHRESTGDYTILISTISSACKWISNVVRKSELLHVVGAVGTQNVQNEQVQKLDVLTDRIMTSMLVGSGKTALLVSEEVEDAYVVPEEQRGKYCVVFDPLDGSSNIECGVSIGTIFGIYRVNPELGATPTIEQVLRPGTEMVAAGYCMYGSSTVLVLALGQGNGVNGFTLDPSIGEFILTHPKMKIGKKKIYSLNEGYASSFEPAIAGYINSLKFPPPGHVGKFTPYSSRYVGSMVADMHRTLLYGGIFLYPGGKLRMLYECFPMAMLVEEAGGKASNGSKRMLECVPKSIHDRSPIYLGSADEVDAVEAWFKKTASSS